MNFPIIPHMIISYLYKRCDLLGGNNWGEDPRRRREEEAPCLSDTRKDFLYSDFMYISREGLSICILHYNRILKVATS